MWTVKILSVNVSIIRVKLKGNFTRWASFWCISSMKCTSNQDLCSKRFPLKSLEIGVPIIVRTCGNSRFTSYFQQNHLFQREIRTETLHSPTGDSGEWLTFRILLCKLKVHHCFASGQQWTKVYEILNLFRPRPPAPSPHRTTIIMFELVTSNPDKQFT